MMRKGFLTITSCTFWTTDSWTDSFVYFLDALASFVLKLFSCPDRVCGQLNRWHCHPLTQWVSEPLLIWEHMTCHWMSKSYQGDFLWSFWKFYHFWTCWQIWTIFDNLDNFDNFGQFWQFWKLLTILTILTIFDNYDNFIDILTFFDNVDIFYHCDNDNRNPGDLLPLRHWLQFWQLRTWIHDNLCDLTIKSDTGQHLQFLRCFRLLYCD